MDWKLTRTVILIILSAIALYSFSAKDLNNKSSFSASVADNVNLRDKIEESEKLADMIGQMLIVGFRGTEVNETSDIVVAVKELNLGGVILFDKDTETKSERNIKDKEQVKKLIDQLQGYAQTPLFISADVEGGRVNRFKDFLDLPSQKDVKDHEIIYFNSSKLLNELGINLNFAPVVDLHFESNPIIGGIGRSFSRDPEVVSKYAQIAIDEHKKNGVISCIKHYPGQGSAVVDNHTEFADVTDTYLEEELEPYKILDADMVMVSHVINRNIDEYPASLSKKHNDILRESFDGVCITDDLSMGVIEKYGLKEALILSINSGCDIMLLSNNLGEYNERLAFEAFDAIFQAVLDGDISKSRINEAYSRIMALKKAYLDK